MEVKILVFICLTGIIAAPLIYSDAKRLNLNTKALWAAGAFIAWILVVPIYLIVNRPFRFLIFMTYLPLPLLGIMLIFGIMGKLFHVGWLESAPGVLLIPMLMAYYISLIMGAVYGYMKKEDSVYLMAFIGIGIWILGFILSGILSFPREVMIGINLILLSALMVLHFMQYMATRKWEARHKRSKR